MVEAKKHISYRDSYLNLIELMENALGIYPYGNELVLQRQGSIFQAIEDLKLHADVSEMELSEQVKQATIGSINAVLDALGYSPLDLLPTNTSIRIRFSLDRFGLDISQVFPDHKPLG